MQNRILGWIIAFGTAFALLYVPFARSGQQTGVHNAPAAANKPFDAHDLTGYWDLTNIGRPSGALNETSDNRPPMTDWAKAMFNKTKTGDNSKLSAGVYPDQSDWNDPLLWCDPTGFPRIMWSYPSSGMRFVQTPDEVMQFFEDGRAWRDVWTDGRKLPATMRNRGGMDMLLESGMETRLSSIRTIMWIKAGSINMALRTATN